LTSARATTKAFLQAVRLPECDIEKGVAEIGLHFGFVRPRKRMAASAAVINSVSGFARRGIKIRNMQAELTTTLYRMPVGSIRRGLDA